MSQNIIEIKNLQKSFKKQQVLKNISLSIPENCVYGLLGPNGAGKSTLLKMITGLLRPDSGQIIFRGIPGAERIWRISEADWNSACLRKSFCLGKPEGTGFDPGGNRSANEGSAGDCRSDWHRKKARREIFSGNEAEAGELPLLFWDIQSFWFWMNRVNGLDPLGIQELAPSDPELSRSGDHGSGIQPYFKWDSADCRLYRNYSKWKTGIWGNCGWKSGSGTAFYENCGSRERGEINEYIS